MIVVYDSQKVARKKKFLEIIASSLITFSIVSLVFYFFSILKEEIKFWSVKKEKVKVTFGDLIVKMDAYEALDNQIDPYFSIYVPKIDAKANIIPNIDPSNSEEYLEALKKGVAHARGTNFPGQEKSIYLFSHSTNSPLNILEYNAVFYLLRKLEKRDKIYIYFLNKKYVYEVTDIVVTDAFDTSWLNEKGQGERLILQTCDPPGTSINRLIVIAKPI